MAMETFNEEVVMRNADGDLVTVHDLALLNLVELTNRIKDVISQSRVGEDFETRKQAVEASIEDLRYDVEACRPVLARLAVYLDNTDKAHTLYLSDEAKQEDLRAVWGNA